MKIKKLIILIAGLILVSISSISSAFTNKIQISAESAILIDSTTEKILYSKNEDKKMYPASTTKILTAILVLENSNVKDIVKVTYEAISTIPSGYSIASLQSDEQLTVEQLLQLMLVHSANDAANVLAYHISGSINNFSELMNNKIEELGLKNTHFTNPSGMHDENHYTTAHDLAILMKYCMKNPTFRKLSSLKYCHIPNTNKNEERLFVTTNQLLLDTINDSPNNYFYKYAIAGKTGYTSQSGNCLVSVSNRDGLELICVVLSSGLYLDSSNEKFIDTKSIFDYGYNNYRIQKICERNSIASQIEISNASMDTKNLDLLILNDISVLVSQDDLKKGILPQIQIEENLMAPISQGKIIGKITYNIDNVEYSSDLIASHSVKKSDFIILIVQGISIVLILVLLYKFLFSKNNPTIYY